jgi:hypothetical protein
VRASQLGALPVWGLVELLEQALLPDAPSAWQPVEPLERVSLLNAPPASVPDGPPAQVWLPVADALPVLSRLDGFPSAVWRQDARLGLACRHSQQDVQQQP